MEKSFLVLDIGNEAVRAMFFKKEEESYAAMGETTQYSERFGVFNGKDFERDILKRTVLKALKTIEITPAQLKKAAILLRLAPNFLRARIITQTHKRTDLKKNIDTEEERKIFRAVFQEARQRISKNFARISGILPQDLEFVNQKAIETKIDGYAVPSLFGYKGENLEFRILSIFIPKYYLQNFRKIMEDAGLKIFRIIHLSQNVHKAIGEKDAIFLDVGDDATQLFLIRNGVLEAVDDFEMGDADFSRVLSQALGLTGRESRHLKERYSRGGLGEDTGRRKLKEIFYDISREWMARLETKLNNLTGLIPPTFFLFGPGSSLPEIREVLREQKWEVKPQPNNASLWLGEY